MRRKDREVFGEDVVDILRRCPFVTVAFGGEPYCVPMHFGMEREGEQLVLYFHGAAEGEKMERLARSPQVAFSGVAALENVPPREGRLCSATARYQSVMGRGTMERVRGEEARRGLFAILRQAGLSTAGEMPEEAVQSTCVLRLTVHTLTGKVHE